MFTDNELTHMHINLNEKRESEWTTSCTWNVCILNENHLSCHERWRILFMQNTQNSSQSLLCFTLPLWLTFCFDVRKVRIEKFDWWKISFISNIVLNAESLLFISSLIQTSFSKGEIYFCFFYMLYWFIFFSEQIRFVTCSLIKSELKVYRIYWIVKFFACSPTGSTLNKAFVEFNRYFFCSLL